MPHERRSNNIQDEADNEQDRAYARQRLPKINRHEMRTRYLYAFRRVLPESVRLRHLDATRAWRRHHVSARSLSLVSRQKMQRTCGIASVIVDMSKGFVISHITSELSAKMRSNMREQEIVPQPRWVSNNRNSSEYVKPQGKTSCINEPL